jgi:predicted nucleic acid-binding protein
LVADDLVIDASAAVKAALTDGFDLLRNRRLHAPRLLISEAAAALRQLEWRAEISREECDAGLERLRHGSIELHDSPSLVVSALTIARELGWAKTYDAEYIALAVDLNADLLTLDARLARAVDGRVDVIEASALER